MRKMTKVLVATALLALGASFTSMAAAKTGTWMLEDDGWYCYDKDGDAYEDEFCLSYGKEYYMGSDGLMVTSSWVEYENDLYYVGSDGAKTVNDWRLVAPEADEDAEEEWFYFGSNGKMVKGKKVIDGKTYYFDDEGIMLTGWVSYVAKKAEPAILGEAVANLVYCDENGARMASTWVETFVPGTAEEDQEDADTFWYYIKSKGGVQTGKNNDINGETYYFNANGQMCYGFVIGEDTNADGKLDNFYSANGENAESLSGKTVFFCGNDDQGWSKKNKWIKTWAPVDFDDQDSDASQYWYYINKNGEVFAPANGSDANAVTFVNGDTPLTIDGTDSNATLKEISKKTYAFNEEGQMLDGLLKIEDEMYYFGGSEDGAMKTGDVMIADEDDYEYKFFFGEKTDAAKGYKKGVAVTGNADGELYIDGQLRTSSEKFEKVWVADLGVYFLIDEDGDIRTTKKVYKDSDDVEVLDATVTGFTFDTSAKKVLNGSFN